MGTTDRERDWGAERKGLRDWGNPTEGAPRGGKGPRRKAEDTRRHQAGPPGTGRGTRGVRPGEGPRVAAYLRGGAAAPRTRGSSGRPPRPAASGSGSVREPGSWGRGAAGGGVSRGRRRCGPGRGSRTRPRAYGGGGALERPLPEFGAPRRLGVGPPATWARVRPGAGGSQRGLEARASPQRMSLPGVPGPAPRGKVKAGWGRRPPPQSE